MSVRGKLTVCVALLMLVCGKALAGSDDVVQGRAIYLHYCVSCHGLNAEGNGPVAPSLKTPPVNLRLLSDLYGNPLQEDKVARAIDGRAEVAAHGPREMPVWGPIFDEISWDGAPGSVRIYNVTRYIQSLQQK